MFWRFELSNDVITMKGTNGGGFDAIQSVQCFHFRTWHESAVSKQLLCKCWADSPSNHEWKKPLYAHGARVNFQFCERYFSFENSIHLTCSGWTSMCARWYSFVDVSMTFSVNALYRIRKRQLYHYNKKIYICPSNCVLQYGFSIIYGVALHSIAFLFAT